MSKLQHSQKKISNDLDTFRFSDAYDTLYHFVWDDLADWYIEASKAGLNEQLVAYVLEQTLVLAHPFAPFLTETIWQTLAWEHDSLLASRLMGPIMEYDHDKAADFSEAQAIIIESRAILKVLDATDVTLYYSGAAAVHNNAETIKRLGHLRAVTEVRDGDGLYLTSTKHRVWLGIDQRTAQRYLNELQAKQGRVIARAQQLQARLNNQNYMEHAPKTVVAQTKQQLTEAQELLAAFEKEMQQFMVMPTATVGDDVSQPPQPPASQTATNDQAEE